MVVTKDRTTEKLQKLKSEEILVAAGIRPAVEELHLENTGIETMSLKAGLKLMNS